jgi:hypothetical protein
MDNGQACASRLPIKRRLSLAYASSLAIAALMTLASIAGILYQSTIYPTEELLESAVPTDVANLCIGLPCLLGSMWLARQGNLAGLLFWPGVLFYAFYTYAVYIMCMPLNGVLLLHLTLVTLSACTIIGLIASIDGEAVRRRLRGHVREGLAGAILTLLGVAFLLQAVGSMISALLSQAPVGQEELALHIADALCAPALVLGGVLLYRREALGYVTGLGLLFQTSMLFVGLILFLIVQPLLTTAPLAWVDVVVVAVLGLICFVPFGLFLRGVGRSTET